MMVLVGTLVLLSDSSASTLIVKMCLRIVHSRLLAALLVSVLLLAICSLVTLPFAFAIEYLERRFGLSRRTWPEKLRSVLKVRLLFFIFIPAITAPLCVILERPDWHLLSWVFLSAAFVIHREIYPLLVMPLLYPLEPIAEGLLAQRFSRLAAASGTRIRGAFIWKWSKGTKKANAMISGLLGRKRLIITDTLLEILSPEELDAVLLHEFGHVVAWDSLKRSILIIALMFPITFVLSISRQTNSTPIEQVPLLWISLMLIGSYTIIIASFLFRRQELSADRFACKHLANPTCFASALRKIYRQNMMPESRVSWSSCHPPLNARIKAIEAFTATEQHRSSAAHTAG